MSDPALWETVPTLVGNHVLVRPLVLGDAEGLAAAVSEETLRYFPFGLDSDIPTTETVSHALNSDRLSLTLCDPRTGEIVGTTALYNMSSLHLRVTVGYTWISSHVQGGPINAETKLLLFDYIFTQLKAARIELNVDELNLRSRAAVTALGATEEGLLLSHARRRDGSRRNTVVFSLLADDWALLKPRLQQRIDRKISEKSN